MSQPPNGISMDSAVFCADHPYVQHTDTHTQETTLRATPVTIGRILRITYRRCCLMKTYMNEIVSKVTTGLWSRSRRLGLETVSGRTNVSSRSRLEKNCHRLGLGHLRLVPKTSFRPNCAGHINESFATNSAARNGVVKTQTGSNSGSDILPRDP